MTLVRFRKIVTSTTSPPLPVPALLGEVIVHAEDIRRPLGISRAYPIDTGRRWRRWPSTTRDLTGCPATS